MPAARPSSAAASVSASKWLSGRTEPPPGVGDLAVELGEPDGQEVTSQGLVVVRRGDLLDLVAQLGEQGRRGLDREHRLAVGVGVDRGRRGVPDAQRARCGRRIASAKGTGGRAPS